ncbi:hypothetical protein [Chryseobacterium daeguense]|uniref:hypothetical protein n=1 Tax=Chryseobacterium daeguense TaxID=412438 RepID=UPI00041AE82F|nr:hypothetical protein [Chryseobacterium daeguense]
MKKKFFSFSFALILLTLCAGLFAHEAKINSYQNTSSENGFQQKSHHSPEVFAVSDLQDVQDCNDLEKIKFDYSVLEQQWLDFFFAESGFSMPTASVQNLVFISAPRYILYHSLQIAGC